MIASNRINDPLLAERILREGKADMVSIGRPIVADPDLPKKAREGKFAGIAPCVACNQGCFDNLFQAAPITCMMNPSVGKEGEIEVKPALKPKKILVVGGGPAGMKAAQIAALRGHHVTLYERADKLGGHLNLASAPPSRGELGTIVGYLSNQLEKLRVEVRLREEATPGLVLAQEPDAVVLATGALPIVPDFPGADPPNVIQAWDVLAGEAVHGKEIVVIGGGGVGCYTAHYLAALGKRVKLLEMSEKIARDVGVSNRWILRDNLRKHGVEVFTSVKVERVLEGAVVATRAGEELTFEAGMVVLAVGSKAGKRLSGELRDKIPGLYEIGGCVDPRKALQAIHKGWSVGMKI